MEILILKRNLFYNITIISYFIIMFKVLQHLVSSSNPKNACISDLFYNLSKNAFFVKYCRLVKVDLELLPVCNFITKIL